MLSKYSVIFPVIKDKIDSGCDTQNFNENTIRNKFMEYEAHSIHFISGIRL